MAMKAPDLADEIKSALGKDTEPTSSETLVVAKAYINALKKAVVNHATVTGTAPSSGGPIQNGSANGGLILGIVGPDIAAEIASGLGQPPTSEMVALGTGFATHVMSGVVNFAAGAITGTCANTPTSPGPFIGEGKGGQVKGLSGSGLAKLWATGFGGEVSDELKKKATAVVKYIQSEAECAYFTGAVNAPAVSAGGGPVVGFGSGGTLS